MTMIVTAGGGRCRLVGDTERQTRQIADRLSRPDLGRWLAQVQQVGHCAHPIRLVGSSDTINPATGEVLRSYAPRRSRTGSPICGAGTGGLGL